MVKRSGDERPTATTHIMEDYLKTLINQVLDKREIELKEEEANKIIKSIIPELDDLISKRVKQHFALLANHIKEKFEET